MNTFDEIIQTKAYSDLSSSELEIIRELVSSEEEYNEMKSFYAGIGQIALSGREEVSASVKSSLNSVFQAKHPGISQNWNAPAEAEKKIVPLYNRNIFRAAALLVLSAGVITVWVSMSDNQLTQTEPKQSIASSDSMAQEKQKESTAKKEFPLNEQTNKEYTASSSVPGDQNNQDNASENDDAAAPMALEPSGYASKDMSVSPASTTKNLNASAESITTFSFSSNQASKQNNWAETRKEESKQGNLARTGLEADLNPAGTYYVESKDYKPSISTTDYLSLIEPSF
ncbi:hypothetical protein [uncultured Fluviicola sp.]|uniref:hypothetical protein n=1 Tax=uncultured Fluviicola sp. TaxID=463303 RepID=UPI0025D2EE20|nr:hypothetical protein [uncultured Fluviicola sp.]